MKKFKRAFAVISAAAMFIAAIPTLSVFAADTDPTEIVYVDGLRFALQPTYATVIDCVPDEGVTEITVPSEYEGRPVTNIGYVSFADCTTLTKVNLPDTIEMIDGYAFKNCINLESVSIPKSVKELSEAVFMGCRKIDNIVVPEGITFIDYSTFAWCTSLKSVTLPSTLTWIKDYAFSYCFALETIDIPESVDIVSNMVFYECTALKNVAIPEKATFMGKHIFNLCESLESMSVPGTVSQIRPRSFYSCTNLKSITIGDGITSIGESAFFNCTGIDTITVPESVTRIDLYALGYTYNEEENGSVKIMDGFKLKGTKDSTAHKYALANGITFVDAATGEVIGPDVTTPTTPVEGKIVYGDVNSDTEVTALDVLVFQKHFIDTPLTGEALEAADVTADGKVALTDLATLKQFVMGDKVPGGRLVR